MQNQKIIELIDSMAALTRANALTGIDAAKSFAGATVSAIVSLEERISALEARHCEEE